MACLALVPFLHTVKDFLKSHLCLRRTNVEERGIKPRDILFEKMTTLSTELSKFNFESYRIVGVPTAPFFLLSG